LERYTAHPREKNSTRNISPQSFCQSPVIYSVTSRVATQQSKNTQFGVDRRLSLGNLCFATYPPHFTLLFLSLLLLSGRVLLL